MPTPISSATPYATVSDLLDRFDVRVIADLLTDDEDATPTLSDLNDPTTDPGRKLYAALQDAAGQIEAACFVGERYTTDDLAALTGNGLAKLKRLTCQIAIDNINRRRCDPNYNTPREMQEAMAFLDALTEGAAIFGLQEAAQAGLEEIDVETPAIVEQRKLVSYTANRLFGTRNNRRG